MKKKTIYVLIPILVLFVVVAGVLVCWIMTEQADKSVVREVHDGYAEGDAFAEPSKQFLDKHQGYYVDDIDEYRAKRPAIAIPADAKRIYVLRTTPTFIATYYSLVFIDHKNIIIGKVGGEL